MNVIVCIDDNMGMLFSGKRQSRDKAVIEEIHRIAQGRNLYINDFSAKLITDNCIVRNDFLDIADEDDFCFVENVPLKEYTEKINRIYGFKWNKSYPYDFGLDIELDGWFQLMNTKEIKGNSHERITMEVWEKGINH